MTLYQNLERFSSPKSGEARKMKNLVATGSEKFLILQFLLNYSLEYLYIQSHYFNVPNISPYVFLFFPSTPDWFRPLILQLNIGSEFKSKVVVIMIRKLRKQKCLQAHKVNKMLVFHVDIIY
ncbi:CLUMA_CG008853, isoform A [Clunio marinus]|uniref:CLUMA_CG008853, isoform A n=1 Tax=Clunio marinus TaxID=568069 RepID=A0A1J1I4X6_9DIPT|nr:CLUMA_CG008853, isoform A [Clunio marinus]